MPADIDQTYGALLIGVMFAIFFQGVLTVQTFVYYESFPEDLRILKALVASVWILDTTHMILIAQTVYHYLVSSWGNDAALTVSTTQLNIHVLFVGLATILCQSFYLFRPNLDPQQKELVADWFTGGGMPDLTRIPNQHHCLSHHGANDSLIQSQTGYGYLDVAIAALLVFYLRTGVWKSSFQNTTSVINRVVQYTVATGAATSVIAVAIVVAHVLAPNGFIHIAIHLSLGRMYSNALLAALNSRKILRETLSGGSRMHSIPHFGTPVVVDVHAYVKS
ncbi:hypothetical protein C8J57DRAFT_1724572 [Mycena rebaudengoi]|nr:hypothetical protein C8J57DRAFT_1724572 [Mycena rebaudengoi]